MRFADALAAPGFGAIAEFKRRSPSAGDLRPAGDVASVARAYEQAGARAMSVLVDERFAGAWEDLRAARAAVSLPLLAKGFFTSDDDLRTAAIAGADAALLLLRDLDDAECAGADARGDGSRARHAGGGTRYGGTRTRDRHRGTDHRDQCSRPLDLRHRPPHAAGSRGECPSRPDRRCGVGHPHARAGRGCRACRSDSHARRLLPHARTGPGREARRVDRTPARQGLWIDASGGRRCRSRRRCRPRRLHPRQGEPAPHGRAPRGARHGAPCCRLRRPRSPIRTPTSSSSTRGRTTIAHAIGSYFATANGSRPSSTFRGSRPIPSTSTAPARPRAG